MALSSTDLCLEYPSLIAKQTTKLHLLTVLLFLLTNVPKPTSLQALLHASVAMERKLVVEWVPSCDLEDSSAKEVGLVVGIESISAPRWSFC
jgi:hypothetical protein